MAIKNFDGKQFGDIKVIGDTGEVNKYGHKIWVVRNILTGEIKESTTSTINNNSFTGYKGSPQQRKNAKEYISSVRKNLNKEEEFKRTIKAKISQYLKAKGYSYHKRSEKYVAKIYIEGKSKSLGSFSTEAEAKAARKKAVDEQIKILKNQLEKDDL